jgi:hypothetical protein
LGAGVVSARPDVKVKLGRDVVWQSILRSHEFSCGKAANILCRRLS